MACSDQAFLGNEYVDLSKYLLGERGVLLGRAQQRILPASLRAPPLTLNSLTDPPPRANCAPAPTLAGPRTGWWALAPFQIVLLWGVSVTYTVTGAGNMLSVAKLQGGAEGVTKISEWILIFSAAQLLLSLVPNFSELAWVSLMGSVMSGFYSIMGTVLAGVYPDAPNVNYQPQDVGRTTAQTFFGVFNALSTVAFAFGGHNIALEIQATLPAEPGESTVAPM